MSGLYALGDGDQSLNGRKQCGSRGLLRSLLSRTQAGTVAAVSHRSPTPSCRTTHQLKVPAVEAGLLLISSTKVGGVYVVGDGPSHRPL